MQMSYQSYASPKSSSAEPFSFQLILTNRCSILRATLIQRRYWTEHSEAHVKALLLADADRLSASPSDHAAIRQQIDAAAYQTLMLSEADFNVLVFMEANDNVWADNQALVDRLTPAGQSRTLKDVVDRILEVYSYQRPIHVFKHLSADEPWFDGCFIISARFDPRLLGELLIRPLTAYEKPAHSPKIRFYLEYGNHRALVYAVSLRLHAEVYQPIRVIFSQDWSHIYPWGQLTS